MDLDESSAPPVRQVRLRLLCGDEHEGALRGFRPEDDHFDLEVASGLPPIATPASEVAWVAFEDDAVAPAGEDGESRPVLRVHLAGGASLPVVPLSDSDDPRGFWARPLALGGFARVYFFRHALHLLERDESIGALLLRDGVVAPEELARGLDRQAALRRRRVGEILLERSRLAPEALRASLEIAQRRRARIGDVLVEAGLVRPEDVEAALAEQRQQRGRRIGELLVEMGVVSEESLARTLADKFHLPFIDLDDCLIDPEAVRAVPRAILEKHRILPIEVDEREITVAIADPLDMEPIDLLRFHRRGRVREVVASPSQITRYIAGLFSEGASSESGAEVASLLQSLGSETAEAGADESEDAALEVRESDNAIIQLANQIILEAVNRGASDIHIEPNGRRDGVKVRFRIDGECLSLPDVPASHRSALVSRLKIMAHLDISERRKPQDGKIRLRLKDRPVELRVATVPTVGGEDVVLRILSASRPIPLAGLELAERNRRELERLVERPYGLVLCVGPTGSGKTTSLHSLLGHINRPGKKIWTAEDPVEITQPGLRQVQVRPRIGFGFGEALRAFLRADPDVIMVGEMRDRETAMTAVEASLTGHLVLSTLHTNSAPETVVRLIEMGLDPFSFGDALLGVLAQRLARRLCESCRSLEPATEASQEALRAALGSDPAADRVGRLLWAAKGCDACRGTGYRGRTALHELLVADDELRAAMHGRAAADRVRELALAGGMTTLLQDGARKCLEGATDLHQVLVVCSR